VVYIRVYHGGTYPGIPWWCLPGYTSLGVTWPGIPHWVLHGRVYHGSREAGYTTVVGRLGIPQGVTYLRVWYTSGCVYLSSHIFGRIGLPEGQRGLSFSPVSLLGFPLKVVNSCSNQCKKPALNPVGRVGRNKNGNNME